MTASRTSKGRRESSPLCLRVTAEEHRFLVERAREGQHGSVSAFVRARVFGMIRSGGGDANVNALGRSSAAERLKMLAQVLGALGSSKALLHLTELAEAARIGVLPITPDVIRDIRAACDAVIDIRNLLLRALGVRRIEGGLE
jgi:hypothetical protein